MPDQLNYPLYNTQQLLSFFNHPDFFFKYLHYAKKYCNSNTPQRDYQIAKEIEKAHQTLENDIREIERHFDEISSSEKKEYVNKLYDFLSISEKIDMICNLSNAAFKETNKHYFYDDLCKKVFLLSSEKRKEKLKEYFYNLLSEMDASISENKKNELLLGQMTQAKKNNFLYEAFDEGNNKDSDEETNKEDALIVPTSKLIAAMLLGANPMGHTSFRAYDTEDDIFTDKKLGEDNASYFHLCILLKNKFTKMAFPIFCDLHEFTKEELNERSHKNKLTPLLVAIYAPSFERTEKLISIGANFTIDVNYPAQSTKPISGVAFLEKLKIYAYTISILEIQSRYKMRTFSCLPEEQQEKVTALLDKPCHEELFSNLTSLLELNDSEKKLLQKAQKYIMELIKIEKLIKEKTLELNTLQTTPSL